ncbi:MAG: peptide chain release factor 2 [Magnetococcales bacterium]|nr:peptide chain release factor 2 [Magnetococcales bacterium]
MDENLEKIFDAVRAKLVLLRGHLDYDNGKERLRELESLSSDPALWNDPAQASRLLREKNILEKTIGEWDHLDQETRDGFELLAMAKEEGDQEVLDEVGEKANALLNRTSELELKQMLSGDADPNNAFIEIHPGAGGTESQDWAEMLMRMYLRWCERQGYEVSMVDFQSGDEAGIKSATLHVKGEFAYGYLKVEAGVHRLVRISPFDASARRHTSFTSVWIYPEVEDDIQIEINEKDLRIDTFRASGAGGQHVNKTSSAIRITHLPTNIVVQCQNQRSQFQNKDEAFKMLRARLFQRELDARNAQAQAVEDSKTDIGWGHQIRSYVLHPYRMVKDLRTDVETGNTDAVLDGALDPFIRAALAQRIAPAQA